MGSWQPFVTNVGKLILCGWDHVGKIKSTIITHDFIRIQLFLMKYLETKNTYILVLKQTYNLF